MPKIIENLKDRLIAEAQTQIEKSGYAPVSGQGWKMREQRDGRSGVRK